jgi:hypothetical protein
MAEDDVLLREGLASLLERSRFVSPGRPTMPHSYSRWFVTYVPPVVAV